MSATGDRRDGHQFSLIKTYFKILAKAIGLSVEEIGVAIGMNGCFRG